MGYCGLDRQRRPISGDEIRACWESRPESMDAAADAIIPAPTRTPVPHREFIEVGSTPSAAAERQARPVATAPLDPDLAGPVVTPRWRLWEDIEA
jgi:hypothetical protein